MAPQRHRVQRAVKRAIDVVVAAAALLVLSPVMALIAMGILLTMGPPVLFRHRRLGLGGREFTLLKFRTMRGRPPGPGAPLDDERRITRLGRLLRALTLDELPELVNVLRGDLSLVGPRPLLPEYRELYTAEQWRRHEMPPGMAGPALAAGRNALSWEEKFAADVDYVRHWSLWLDARVLGLSIWRVLRREGVSAEGHATMPRFEGPRE
ncbi:MAG TPA: sugar transferase [Solirubrobacteraceae bacterium]|jgi:lipopolysaccharide/colanic/teichoic acid biosynthesis glycosyltransferase|nr:sugar transferase [Solirubrobacteraceae bacterium]